MKIIGIQILEGTNSTISKSLKLGWYPLVKCENDLELDNKLLPIIAKDYCPDGYYKINKDLPSISVCAIAGKNGSGKSSLLEIIYRILNNFSATLLSSASDNNNDTEVLYANGLEARLFFEFEGRIKYIYNHNLVSNYYEEINGECVEVSIAKLNQKKRNDILRGFFYTIAINYSLYALNCADYDPIIPKANEQLGVGKWLNYMFHKNDGYYIPIVLTPYRNNGEIGINNENHLALQRLSVFSLLFQSQGKTFIEGYIPIELQYRYIEDYKEKKTESFRRHLKDTFPELTNGVDLLIRHFESAWAKKIEEELEYDLGDYSNPQNETILFFLAYKSTKICLTYPSFREMLDLDSILNLKKVATSTDNKNSEKFVSVQEIRRWLNIETKRVNAIVRELYREENHITIKIHQCIDYLTSERYKDKCLHSISYADLIGKTKYKTYDEVFRLLPPAFFKIDLKLQKKAKVQKADIRSKSNVITLQTMSSGERQLLYSMSYIFYHIKNIASIQEDGKRVGYHHINLIFDEAELYYHPEFQRIFIKRLLDNLALCHIDKRVIRSINIIIVTHSPFLLSDIPETNILFLGGEEQKAHQKTFGANIYDLLKSSFFMDSAIGEFAQYKLNELMRVYYNEEKNTEKQKAVFLENYDEFKFTAEHVADDYLSKTFLFMFNELQQKFKPDGAKLNMEEELLQIESKAAILRKKLGK